jgi:acyl-coenzyme A synthetase/AMP-(fatty) acid ligase
MTCIVAQRLLQHARERPLADAVRTPAGAWTWRELAAAAASVAAALRARGLQPGAVVALQMENRPELVAAALGVMLADCVPSPIFARDARAEASLRDVVEPRAWLVTGDRDASASLPLLRLSARGRALAAAWTEPACDAGRSGSTLLSAAAFVVSTSGTTAQPKAVVWSEPRLMALLAAAHTPRQANACVGMLRPLAQAAGWLQLARALYWGVPLALVEHSFAVLPAVASMAELGATGFSCTPLHAALLLEAGVQLPPTVHAVRVSGGGLTPKELLAFAEAVRPARLFASYGLAETGAVSVLRPEVLRERAHSCGQSVPGYAVSIEAEDGRRLPPGEVGEIVVRLPAWEASDGYRNAPADVQARFREGVLHTTDRGYLDPEGFLVFCERTAELIKVAGHSVSAPQLEARLCAAGDAPLLVAVGVPHPRYGQVPAVVYEAPGLSPNAAWRAHAVPPDGPARPRWWLARRALPRHATGKLDRRRLSFEAHRWVEQWPESLALAGRLWPARPVPAAAGEWWLIDGLPEDWRDAFAPRGPAAADARELTLLRADAGARPVARAQLRDGVDLATAGIRVIQGPDFAASCNERADGTAWLAMIVTLAATLPGPEASTVAMLTPAAELTPLLELLGFVPWQRQPATWIAPVGIAGDATLDTPADADARLTRVAQVLAGTAAARRGSEEGK